MKLFVYSPIKKVYFILICLLFCFMQNSFSMDNFEKDTINTSDGDLIITFIGHGTLMFEYKNLIIHVDPTMGEADYSKSPIGSLILVTHQHGDHFDVNALQHIMKDGTILFLTEKCAENAEDLAITKVLKNGDITKAYDITIEAIPAYNIKHLRKNGKPYHPKGEGNGYIMTFGDKKVYIAGDTENIPEMKALKDIDIAFLPMNLPYTMTPEMVADAAKAFRPKILYPYHFGSTNTMELVNLLKNENNIEVRIRDMN